MIVPFPVLEPTATVEFICSVRLISQFRLSAPVTSKLPVIEMASDTVEVSVCCIGLVIVQTLVPEAVMPVPEIV